MLSESAFVEASVKMQLGQFAGPYGQSDDALMYAMRASSGTSGALLPDATTPMRLDRGEKPPVLVSDDTIWTWRKTGAALAEIVGLNPKFGFVADMQDRRMRQISPEGVPPYPTFSFNRITSHTRHILWPLPIYHDLDGDQFLADVKPDAVAWEDKKPAVIWRGITGGRTAGAQSAFDDGFRLKAILRKMRNGAMTPGKAGELIATLPRHRAIQSTLDDPRFDFGFVDGDGFTIRDTPFHAHLEKPRVTRQYMQGYRYIAVLRGLDVGSSFFWTMNSGSVGLVMETPFDTFASAHFRPWEHYVPFKEDLSDLHANLDWAEANPDACRDMVQAASEVCGMLARADLRRQSLGGVIEEVNAMPVDG